MTTGGSFGFVTVDMVARVGEGNRDPNIQTYDYGRIIRRQSIILYQKPSFFEACRQARWRCFLADASRLLGSSSSSSSIFIYRPTP